MYFHTQIHTYAYMREYVCETMHVCTRTCPLRTYAYIHVCVCECVVIGSLRHADDIMQRRRQQSAKHLSQLPSVPLNVRVCVRAGV